MSCMSCIVVYRWTQNCRTAPSITKGHPTGMWESSKLSPLFSMMVPSMGTSIVTLRLTCSFLQFHASGARKPFSAKCANAGKHGSSSCGIISSLMISLTDRIPNKSRGPAVEAAIEEIEDILPKLEARMIEFLAEWLVSLLMPAQSVLEVRAPHLSFMFQKQYWFREIYLGLKVTASFGRSESYTRVVDGQVRCITPDTTSQSLQVIWNVQYIIAFIPAWMVPPIYHSIQRETVKTTKQTGELGYRSIRPTWFEDDTSLHGQKPLPNQDPPQEMHGLRLAHSSAKYRRAILVTHWWLL